jgi:uncharacterized OsmC-like protein
MKNNLNLKAIEETKEKLIRGEFPEVKSFVVEGSWITEPNEKGQFHAVLEFPAGTLPLTTDQPPPMGGKGHEPNAVQYCVFAMLACYATTFVTLATEKGITIKSLKVRGASEVNMKGVLGIEEGPIVKRVWIELEVESDASQEVLEELRRLADQKCPAAFTVQNPVPFQSKLA